MERLGVLPRDSHTMEEGVQMAVMGFRCEPRGIRWVLMDGQRGAPRLLDKGRIRIPQNKERPAELSWLLRELRELLARTNPAAVAYKRPERSRGGPNVQTVEGQAMVQVAAHDAGAEEVEGVLKVSLRSRLGYEGDARYITRMVDSWPLEGIGRSEQEREAALAACSVLPEE